MEDYQAPIDDDPNSPSAILAATEPDQRPPSFPLVADLRPGYAQTRVLRLVPKILALLAAWGLLGGLWLSAVIYWSGHRLPFPAVEYWTGTTGVLLGIPVLVTYAVSRNRESDLPVEIRVDGGGFSLSFPGQRTGRWNWADPRTIARLKDLSEVAIFPPPPERAFSLEVQAPSYIQIPISEAVYLAILDSARTAGATIRVHDVERFTRRASPGAEFVEILGRSNPST